VKRALLSLQGRSVSLDELKPAKLKLLSERGVAARKRRPK